MTTSASENSTPPPVPADEPNAESLVELDPKSAHFNFEENKLKMRREDEEEWQDVTLARLFPLTDPEGWISVIANEDKEIGVLSTLHGLSRDSLSHVRKELHRRYMIPEIKRIIDCRDRFDLLEWEVETDRGLVKILMRHPQENIKHPLPGRYCLTDVEGNRFDILDFEALDLSSQQFVLMRL